jgi:calcineurin-like phosphoesterase family protein
MNEELIKRWNSCVKQQDTVYHLGDFAWRNLEEIKSRLNGHIHICTGNHDRLNLEQKKLFQSVSQIKVIKHPYGCGKITLCHYALRSWYKSYDDYWHFYGHSHGNQKIILSGSLDVGVDTNNFYPYSIDDIKIKLNSDVYKNATG